MGGTSRDHALALRKAIVAYLRAQPSISAIVADRVYGEDPPPALVWPFIRYGLPVLAPGRYSCWGGSQHAMTLHAFSKGHGTDQIATLNAAIVEALDDKDVPIASPIALLIVSHTGTQILRDGEEMSAYHGVLDFDVTTAEFTT